MHSEDHVPMKGILKAPEPEILDARARPGKVTFIDHARGTPIHVIYHVERAEYKLTRKEKGCGSCACSVF